MKKAMIFMIDEAILIGIRQVFKIKTKRNEGLLKHYNKSGL